MAVTPVIEAADCTVSGSNTASGSWAVSVPAAAAGDLLIVNLAWDDSTTTSSVTAPAGPNSEVATSIEGPIASASTEVRGQAWSYVATGSWSAGTLTFTPSASESWSATVIKVPAGEFDAAAPIGANSSRASTGTAETSVLSPAFSADATDGDGRLVWFALVDADPLSATNPTGWTIRQRQDLGDVAHGIATRNAAVTNSESITAGSWAIASDSWASIAYIVRSPPALYYVVYPSAASEPSAAQVKAGQQQSGAAATAAGNETARTTTGEEVFAVAASGLTGGTSYKTSFVWSDGATNSNVHTTGAWTTDTVAALTGSAATASAGTAGVTHTQAASGSAVTASAGTLTALAEYSAALTGASATASAGTVSPAVSVVLAGSAVSAASGAIASVRTVTVSGSQVYATAGGVVAACSAALTGSSGTASAGSVATGISVALQGSAVTISSGALVGSASLGVTGSAAIAFAGSVAASVERALSGSEAAAASGAVTPSLGGSVSLSGSEATAHAGSVGAQVSVALSAATVSVDAGTVSITVGSDVTVALTGSEVLASAGTLGGYTNLGLTGIEVGLFAGSVEPDAVVGHSVHSTGGGGGGGSRLWSRDLDEEIEEEMGAILRGPVLTPEVIEAVAARLDSPPEIRIIERRPPPGPRYAVPTLDFAATQARKRKNRQRLLLLL